MSHETYPKPTTNEAALLRALHRVQMEPVAKAFGERYDQLTDEEMARYERDWLPLIRTHVEIALVEQRQRVTTRVMAGWAHEK